MLPLCSTSRVNHVKQTWVISHTWMNHLKHTSGSWRMVMTNKWFRYITVVLDAESESCQTNVGHDTHMNESCQTHQWIMTNSHDKQTNHVKHISGSWRIVMTNKWIRYVIFALDAESGSWHTQMRVMSHNEWLMSHTNAGHVTYTDQSYHTHEYVRVMLHTQINHVTHMNISCHSDKWVMSPLSATPKASTDYLYVTHIDGSWHTHK